ncbi:MAG TPA: c-type cytochrome, partial [Bryobacteraceae bacterium]|nr:c-type cytochrome [Bryobacteraceae bacterium]
MRAAILILLAAGAAFAQENCTVTRPTASFQVPHAAGDPPISADPASPIWHNASVAVISKDCSKELDYPALRSEVRAFWTDQHLFLLFRCPYKELNLWLPAQGGGPRNKLWDRDVVEMFLGDDWTNIRHYREFEIAPTGDWIDLAIDLDRQSYDQSWRSGWTTAAHIDEAARIWYAAARIPLSAVSSTPVKPGTKWRANLYRIDGPGEDPVRHFMCWQPTCVVNRDPNHVPESFGTIVFTGGADAIAAGRQRFEVRCGGCHGADGTGGERAPAIGSIDRHRLRSEEAIRTLIHSGIPEAGMPSFNLPDSEMAEITAFVHSRVIPASDSTLPGDPKAGAAFFFGAGRCAECHMIHGRGDVRGPDLTSVGAELTLSELEQSLLKPEARRVPGYQVATVRVRSGAPIHGFLRNESLYDLQVQGFDGQFHLLRRADVLAVEREKASYMPALKANAAQLQDLVAFLAAPNVAVEATRTADFPGAVTWEGVAYPMPGDWPTYHGQLTGNRYTELNEITPQNVAQLAPRWIFPIAGARHLEV